MTLLLIPFAGLALVGPAIWAAAIFMDRRHHRHNMHERELDAIDAWLAAIRSTR